MKNYARRLGTSQDWRGYSNLKRLQKKNFCDKDRLLFYFKRTSKLPEEVTSHYLVIASIPLSILLSDIMASKCKNCGPSCLSDFYSQRVLEMDVKLEFTNLNNKISSKY